MQGYIDSGVVHKPGEIPMFYKRIDPRFIPKVVQNDHDEYSYPFVVGRCATSEDVRQILEVCADYIWHGTGYLLPKRLVSKYIEHVTSVAWKHEVIHYSIVTAALDYISHSTHPLSRNVHGDLTFENIVITPENNIVFIDPGLPRGMYTAALDRGKLLQSAVMRWEERQWHSPNPIPSWATPMDLAFLVTHWVRLIPHWPNVPTKSGLDVLASLIGTRLSSTSTA